MSEDTVRYSFETEHFSGQDSCVWFLLRVLFLCLRCRLNFHSPLNINIWVKIMAIATTIYIKPRNWSKLTDGELCEKHTSTYKRKEHYHFLLQYNFLNFFTLVESPLHRKITIISTLLWKTKVAHAFTFLFQGVYIYCMPLHIFSHVKFWKSSSTCKVL